LCHELHRPGHFRGESFTEASLFRLDPDDLDFNAFFQGFQEEGQRDAVAAEGNASRVLQAHSAD
jgi:hypothetical protein